MVGWPKLGEAAVGTGLRMRRWAGLRGGSLSPAFPNLAEVCVVLRPWCLLPSYPPRGSSYARRGSGPAVEAGGPLGIRVQSERPSGTNILWAVERLAE